MLETISLIALHVASDVGSIPKEAGSMFETIGLIASLVSIILGFLAIWLSLYFYRESGKILMQIFSSSKTSEVHSKDVSAKLLEVIRTWHSETLKNTATEVKGLTETELKELSKKVSSESEKEAISKSMNNIINQINQVFKSSATSRPDEWEPLEDDFELASFIKMIKTT